MGARYDQSSGKLYIYSPGTTEVRAAWPRPMAWRKSNQDPSWRHVRPSLSLPKRPVPGELQRFHARERRFPYKRHLSPAEEKAAIRRGEKLARLEWAKRVPDPVRSVIAPFATRQWHLLSMAARCGEPAVDLIRCNPALAYMLASNWVFHTPAVKQPLRSVRVLLKPGRKQVDMLAWLGFPPRPAVRRLLARIPPASIDVSRLLYLRDTCHDAAALRQLFHLPRLNAGCLRIVSDPALLPRVTQSLLLDIGSDHREDARRFRSARMLMDTLQAFEQVGTSFAVLPARTIEQLEQCHDAAVDELNRHNRRAGHTGAAAFPDPPLQGDDAVRPITSARELRAEGIDMNHCVAVYEGRIAADRSCYIYRVLAPERATLALRRTYRGWTITELKGPRNQPVSSETRSRVQAWYDSAAGARSGAG